jgi:hypothetical protein
MIRRTILFVFAGLLCSVSISLAHDGVYGHALRSYPHRGAVRVNINTSVGISYNAALDSSSLEAGIIVTGNKYGLYSGSLTLSCDHRTLIFKPSQPFLPGEIISVNAQSLHMTGGSVTAPVAYTFTTALVSAPVHNDLEIERSSAPLSIPDTGLLPRITVTKNTNPAPGQIYFANIFDPSNVFYRIRVNNDGTIAFAKAMGGNAATDYRANPNGTYSWVNYNLHAAYIADTNDKIIDSIKGANGFPIDIHEFRYTPDGNYLIIADDDAVTDMSQLIPGGMKNAVVRFPVIQEFDKKHHLIFEWNTKDYFNVLDGYNQLYTASFIDFSHMNSLDVDADGNILASNRNMNELTKVDIQTGEIIWRMGGNNNTFTFLKDHYGFSGQHHFRRIANGNFTGFDDGNYRPGTSTFSRAIEYKLDQPNLTATEVWEFRHTPDRFATGMGSTQRLSNGNTAIGWGFADTVGYTEVDSLGNTVFELNFLSGSHSYRVYKFDSAYIHTHEHTAIMEAGDHDFATVLIGDTAFKSVQINNSGAAAIRITAANIFSDSNIFSLDTGTRFPLEIPAHSAIYVNVRFHPQAEQVYSDTMQWVNDIPFESGNVQKSLTSVKGQGVRVSSVRSSKPDSHFMISPNPARGMSVNVTVANPDLNSTLSVYDILGKQVYEKDISGWDEIPIPIRELPEGVYSVILRSPTGTSTGRFSKLK